MHDPRGEIGAGVCQIGQCRVIANGISCRWRRRRFKPGKSVRSASRLAEPFVRIREIALKRRTADNATHYERIEFLSSVEDALMM